MHQNFGENHEMKHVTYPSLNVNPLGKLCGGTVLPNNMLFGGTVLTNNTLFVETPESHKISLI